MLMQLVYLSATKNLIKEDELAAILEKSQNNNQALEITGALIYHDGNFIQLLEGPEETVLSLYEKIKKDNRHYAVTTLIQAPVHEREFSNWAMMFRNVDKLPQELLDKNPVMNTPLTDRELAKRPSRVLELLRAFKDNATF